jgi:hypothetical protein
MTPAEIAQLASERAAWLVQRRQFWAAGNITRVRDFLVERVDGLSQADAERYARAAVLEVLPPTPPADPERAARQEAEREEWRAANKTVAAK